MDALSLSSLSLSSLSLIDCTRNGCCRALFMAIILVLVPLSNGFSVAGGRHRLLVSKQRPQQQQHVGTAATLIGATMEDNVRYTLPRKNMILSTSSLAAALENDGYASITTTKTKTTTKKVTAIQDNGNDRNRMNDDNDNVILYDGVCNFCNAWVDILLRLDTNKQFRFAPLQSTVGQRLLVQIGKEANDISSVVLIRKCSSNNNNNGGGATLEYFDKSACVLQVIQTLGFPGQVLARVAQTLVPTSFRDDIYDTVAENRYKLLGKRAECRCSDPEYADRFLLL